MKFRKSRRIIFDGRPKNSAQGPKKTGKNIFFVKKYSKCSYRHVESIFDNPCERNLAEGRRCFAQCPRTKKRKKLFFLNCFSGHVE